MGDTCLIAMVELCCNYLSSKDYVARHMAVGKVFIYHNRTQNTSSWNSAGTCTRLHRPSWPGERSQYRDSHVLDGSGFKLQWGKIFHTYSDWL
jgi:hypothetical protein